MYKLLKAALGVAFYLGLLALGIKGYTFAEGLFITITWMQLLLCLFAACSKDCQEKIKEAQKVEKWLSLWLSIPYEVIILFSLFHYEWKTTAVAYSVALGLALYVRFTVAEGIKNDEQHLNAKDSQG